jgi:large subunit ribosomal protein L25
MMTLSATPREEVGKAARTLIKDGKIPAVVYGPDRAAEAVTLDSAELSRVLRHEGESTVVEVAGLGGNFQALIKEINRDPVTHQPRHADLYAIKKGAKVTVTVELTFVGEAPAEKLGASIVKIMHEIEVEADPSHVPHALEVSVESLANVGDQIHVSDIKLPAGATINVDPEEVVALAQEVQQEAEEETAAPDMDAIEVEQKGKAEDGEEEEKKEGE